MIDLRIIFMGTPEFAVPSLKMLHEAGYKIVAVVTQPDKPKGRGNKLSESPVKEFAISKGIEVLQPVKVRTKEFVDSLKEFNPNLFVTAAYGRILTAEVLAIPEFGCINVHGSLLPKYRGASPIQTAIINGEKITGITTMFTDVGMDTGDILLKSEIEIGENITSSELHDILSELGAKALKNTIEALLDGNLKRIPQENALSTHCAMLQKETGKIDWNKPAKDVHNLVRGTNPWPGAFTYHSGQRLRIWKTEVMDGNYDHAKHGQILVFKKGEFIVKAKDGLIKILELQADSSRRMTSKEFAAGHLILEGDILE